MIHDKMHYYNVEIKLNLDDIKEYAEGALNYIKGDELDRDEIIAALSCIKEKVNNIKDDLIDYLDYLNNQIEDEQLNSYIEGLIVNLTEEGEDNE